MIMFSGWAQGIYYLIVLIGVAGALSTQIKKKENKKQKERQHTTISFSRGACAWARGMNNKEREHR